MVTLTGNKAPKSLTKASTCIESISGPKFGVYNTGMASFFKLTNIFRGDTNQI